MESLLRMNLSSEWIQMHDISDGVGGATPLCLMAAAAPDGVWPDK